MLNTAQKLLIEIVSGGNSLRDYKAPHAYCGTPKRRKRRSSAVMNPRLFKGHRP